MVFHPIEDEMSASLRNLGKVADHFRSKGQIELANEVGRLSMLILNGWNEVIKDALIPESDFNGQSLDQTTVAQQAANLQKAVVSPVVDKDQESKSGVSTISGLTDISISTESSISTGSDNSRIDDKQTDDIKASGNKAIGSMVSDNKAIYSIVSGNKANDIEANYRNSLSNKLNGSMASDNKANGVEANGSKAVSSMVNDNKAIYSIVSGNKAIGSMINDNKVNDIEANYRNAISNKLNGSMVSDNKAIYNRAIGSMVNDNKAIYSIVSGNKAIGSMVNDNKANDTETNERKAIYRKAISNKVNDSMVSDNKANDIEANGRNAIYRKAIGSTVSDYKAIYSRAIDNKDNDIQAKDNKAFYSWTGDNMVNGDKANGNGVFNSWIGDNKVGDNKANGYEANGNKTNGNDVFYSWTGDNKANGNETNGNVSASQVPKGDGQSAQAESMALVAVGYHGQTGNRAPFGQSQMTEGVPSPEQTLNSSESSKMPVQAAKSPDMPEAKAGVVLIRGPFSHNFVSQVTSRIHEGPLQDIRMVSRGCVKVVFQHVSQAMAFLNSNMEMKESLGSGRFGYGYEMKLAETIDWNEDLRRMNQPYRERRRLSFARKSMFSDNLTQDRWKQDIYNLAGPGNVDFLWVFNNGNATAVFSSTLAARRVLDVFTTMSAGPSDYRDVSVTFSSDPCEKELVLARDRGRPIRNNHRGNYRGNNGHRGRGFYSQPRGGGSVGGGMSSRPVH